MGTRALKRFKIIVQNQIAHLHEYFFGQKTKGWKFHAGLFPPKFYYCMASADYGINYWIWETNEGLFRAKIRKKYYSKASETVWKST